MAISIDTPVFSNNYVRNLVVVKATGSKRVIQVGDHAVSVYELGTDWPSNVDEDDFITFIWGKNVVKMIAKDVPDDSGDQFLSYQGYADQWPGAPGSPTLIGYLNTVVSFFEKNYYLNRDFTIVAFDSTGTFQFAAKQKGDDFVINQSGSNHSLHGFWRTTELYDNDEEIQPHYQIALTLQVEDLATTDQFNWIPPIYATANESGLAVFQLQRALAALLQEDDIPAAGISSPFKCNYTQRRFKYTVSEYYGDQPTHKFPVTQGPFHALKGGVLYNDFKIVSDFHQNYVKANKKFLSWDPKIRRITKTQEHWISWRNYSQTDNTFVFFAKVHFTDGAVDGTSHNIHQVDIDEDEVYTFPISFDLLPTELIAINHPDKEIEWMEVWISRLGQSSTPETEVLNIYFVDEHYLDRLFYYQNAYGVMEVLRCTGSHQLGMKSNKDEFLQSVDPDYTIGTGHIKQVPRGWGFKEQGSTGYMDKEELLPLVQLLTSKKVFELKEGKLHEVIIPSQDVVLVSSKEAEGEYLYAFNFNYYPANEEYGYSSV